MRYRFIGQYTHGRTSICMNGVTFEGRDPSEVPVKLDFRFAGNIEFEAVATSVTAPTAEPIAAPKPRRRRKANQ